MTNWKPVVSALLGSWPQQVAGWGPEAIAAYCAELSARGVSAEQAIVALRSCGAEQKWPPSAPELAGMALRDPEAPEFDEVLHLIFDRDGVLRARQPYAGSQTMSEFHTRRRETRVARARTMHPRVLQFVEWFGLEKLLETDASDKWARKEMRESFAAMIQTHQTRSLSKAARTSLTPASRGQLNA